MVIDKIIYKYKIDAEDQFWLKAIKYDLQDLNNQLIHAKKMIANLEAQNKFLLKKMKGEQNEQKH